MRCHLNPPFRLRQLWSRRKCRDIAHSRGKAAHRVLSRASLQEGQSCGFPRYFTSSFAQAQVQSAMGVGLSQSSQVASLAAFKSASR